MYMYVDGLYLEYHNVCPLVRIRSAHPFSHKRVQAPPPRAAGEGVGGPNSDDWRESMALCLLCDNIYLQCFDDECTLVHCTQTLYKVHVRSRYRTYGNT
jgi:hypothetical protein